MRWAQRRGLQLGRQDEELVGAGLGRQAQAADHREGDGGQQEARDDAGEQRVPERGGGRCSRTARLRGYGAALAPARPTRAARRRTGPDRTTQDGPYGPAAAGRAAPYREHSPVRPSRLDPLTTGRSHDCSFPPACSNRRPGSPSRPAATPTRTSCSSPAPRRTAPRPSAWAARSAPSACPTPSTTAWSSASGAA